MSLQRSQVFSSETLAEGAACLAQQQVKAELDTQDMKAELQERFLIYAWLQNPVKGFGSKTSLNNIDYAVVNPYPSCKVFLQGSNAIDE